MSGAWRSPARWLAIALALLTLTPVAFAGGTGPLQLQDDQTLTADARRSSDALFANAIARLPEVWRQGLPDVVPVQWTTSLPEHVQARATRGRIRLDRRLLDALSSDAAPQAWRAAEAALLHELAHVFDRGAHGGLSHDPRLRDLAGWQRRPLLPGRGDNAFSDRSPDRYELSSPAEFVAVNLEHALLDADYACRRPALHAWFSARLGALPGGDCDATLPLLQADSAEGAVSLQALDPERIFEVDYLLAEGNDAFASRWGHSMLRLVVCSPGRPRGPACRLDLQHHRVLSFRAFVGDLQLSSWRGLTGAYPARLFVLPLDQVIDEYTKVELRGLQSVPLALRREEIAALLQRAAQVHWSYDGRYRFIGNNCAVETWKLLHDALPRLAALRLAGITPTGLLRRLQRDGIADAQVLDDHAQALRDGYYFASAQQHYQAMFDVASATLPLPLRDVEDWLDASPLQRRDWFDRADLRATAALLLLEQAAQRRAELAMRDLVKRRLLGAGDAVSRRQRDEAQSVLGQVGVLARPAALLEGVEGYGVPQQAERLLVVERAGEHSRRLMDDWAALRSDVRDGLPARERITLQQVEENLELIGARLRALSVTQPQS